MKYQVCATTKTIYEVDAADQEDAIKQPRPSVLKSTGEMSAWPLCPDCTSPLSSITTRTIDLDDGGTDEEATYCETCDREVDWEEEEEEA